MKRAWIATVLFAVQPESLARENPEPDVARQATTCGPVDGIVAGERGGRLLLVTEEVTGRHSIPTLWSLGVSEGDVGIVRVRGLPTPVNDLSVDPFGRYLAMASPRWADDKNALHPPAFEVMEIEAGDTHLEIFRHPNSQDFYNEGAYHWALAGHDEPVLALQFAREAGHDERAANLDALVRKEALPWPGPPVNVGPVRDWLVARTAPRSGHPTLSSNAAWLAIATSEGISVHSVDPAGIGAGSSLQCTATVLEPPPAHAIADDGTLGCLLAKGKGVELVLFSRDGSRTSIPVSDLARELHVLSQAWEGGDLRWLVWGNAPAIELFGPERRERIELPGIPVELEPIAPELVAMLDTEGAVALVRRDGATLRLNVCGGTPADDSQPSLRVSASWHESARRSDACRVGEFQDLIEAFVGRAGCVHD